MLQFNVSRLYSNVEEMLKGHDFEQLKAAWTSRFVKM